MNLFDLLNKILLQIANINKVFGSPVRPPGPVFINPVEGISRVVVTLMSVFVSFAFLVALIYLLIGALNWITSEGEQEKLEKARLQMTHAFLGMIIMIAMIGIFTVITGDILGVIRRDSEGKWRLVLPQVNSCVQDGQACIESSSKCCNSSFSCNNQNGTGGYKCQLPPPPP